MGDDARGPSMAVGERQTAAAGLRSRIEAWLEAERSQLPLWLPVGLCGGVAAWWTLPTPAAWAGFACGSAALALIGFAFGHGGRAGRALALFTTAMLLGCALIWWRGERVAAPRLARPQVAQFAAMVERIEPLPARDVTRLTLAPVPVRAPDPAGALPRRVRVTVADPLPQGVAAGATVSLRARLMPPPEATVPGAYDYAAVAWFRGIGAVGKALDPVRLMRPARVTAPGDWLAGARLALSAHIRTRLPPRPAGVAVALATGDMGAIGDADAEAFRRSGLAHLLSVSGLHLTAVVGGVMAVALRLLALSPWLALRLPLPLAAAGAGALAGIGYTLLTGAEVPTLRSLIAALIVLAGLALGREAVTLRMVATGATVVLLAWPEQAAGPSFQLSFAAIVAIVALHELPWSERRFARREEPRARRLARAIAGLLLTGLVVEAALMPIAVFHFHRAGFYGALANIVAIPLTTFVIMPAEGAALLLDALGIGALCWAVARIALRALLGLAQHVAALPGAVALVPAMGRGAFALIVAGGLWLALWRTRARLLGVVPIVAGLALTLTASAPDILVTGDGRHVAIRGPHGEVALLRERTGDYVRDALAELGGVEGDATREIATLPGAACSRDACEAAIVRDGRMWRLLATRSAYVVPRRALAQACARADVVVSERRLPGWCRPRWIRADAALLATTGGLAIRLAPPAIDTVAARQARHPWARRR